MSSQSRSNRVEVPGSKRTAMDKFKTEGPSELGVKLKGRAITS